MDKDKISFCDMLRIADMIMKDYDNDPKPVYFDAENTISDIERLNRNENSKKWY